MKKLLALLLTAVLMLCAFTSCGIGLSSDISKLTFPVGEDCTVTNAEGLTLRVTDGELSGDMKVYGQTVSETGDEMTVSVDSSEYYVCEGKSFTLSRDPDVYTQVGGESNGRFRLSEDTVAVLNCKKEYTGKLRTENGNVTLQFPAETYADEIEMTVDTVTFRGLVGESDYGTSYGGRTVIYESTLAEGERVYGEADEAASGTPKGLHFKLRNAFYSNITITDEDGGTCRMVFKETDPQHPSRLCGSMDILDHYKSIGIPGPNDICVVLDPDKTYTVSNLTDDCYVCAEDTRYEGSDPRGKKLEFEGEGLREIVISEDTVILRGSLDASSKYGEEYRGRKVIYEP